jgi:hypothetical protein
VGDGVAAVLGGRHRFEVRAAVVVLSSVDVIDDPIGRRGAVERRLAAGDGDLNVARVILDSTYPLGAGPRRTIVPWRRPQTGLAPAQAAEVGDHVDVGPGAQAEIQRLDSIFEVRWKSSWCMGTLGRRMAWKKEGRRAPGVA